MYSARFMIAVTVLIFSAGLYSSQNARSQNVERDQTVLLKEVNFSGEVGESANELREYTEFLIGRRAEGKKIQEDASSAVGGALRHRGYLKAQVTPQLRTLKTSPGARDAEVALDLTIKPGKQYRVKGVAFAGLSHQLSERKLRQACDIGGGEIADGNKVGVCTANLRALFHKNGRDVFVVPTIRFDEAGATVSFEFDVEK